MTDQSDFDLFGRAVAHMIEARGIGPDDVEIIIRCKTPAAENAIQRAAIDAINAAGAMTITIDFAGIQRFDYLGIPYMIMLAPTADEEHQQTLDRINAGARPLKGHFKG